MAIPESEPSDSGIFMNAINILLLPHEVSF